jgi:hypothetical protein
VQISLAEGLSQLQTVTGVLKYCCKYDVVIVQNSRVMPISLPNAVVGSVVTRFPPEPSWMLDLGHCKASLMNQYIATQFKVPPSAVQACHRVL